MTPEAGTRRKILCEVFIDQMIQNRSKRWKSRVLYATQWKCIEIFFFTKSDFTVTKNCETVHLCALVYYTLTAYPNYVVNLKYSIFYWKLGVRKMKPLETYTSLTRTFLPVPALRVIWNFLSINGHWLSSSVLKIIIDSVSLRRLALCSLQFHCTS